MSDPTIVSVPTPQAASLGKFGRVPVDLFNGLYDMSIPVYTLPVKGHNMDVRLSYHSGGVKPTEKGGTLGVGWSLAATGSITRVQNGTLDEHVNTSYPDPMLGYYWNQQQLNISNWDSGSAVSNFLTQIACDVAGTCASQWHDWAPDEFIFNFFGYSGSFWLDNNGAWQIRENNGEKLTITVSVAPYTYQYPGSTTNSVQVQYCFQNFKITDGNGNVFVFGNDANSIEFNRNSSTDLLPATATSWYLTQVTTARGEKVTFSYSRLWYSYSIFGAMNAYMAQLASNNYSEYNLQKFSSIIHDPVYLQSINYNNVSVQFTYSPSNIYYYSSSTTLDAYGEPSEDNTIYQYLSSPKGSSLPQGLSGSKPVDYKLDQIKVVYGSYSKQYNFSYYDSTVANRLFLKSFSIGPVTRPLVYQFAYNGTRFSNYADIQIEDGILTTKVDNWGFYTGKFPFKTSDLPSTFGNYNKQYSDASLNAYPNDDFITNYNANRQPVADSMKVGSLSQIVYPTGGYTNFIYEPHDYSSQINLTNYKTSFLSSNNLAGGLRIKEVDSYSDPNSPPFIKRYVYKNDNGYSSGVLNTAGILYKDSVSATTGVGTLTLKYFSDNNLFPLQNANGNHVTYSRIDEIDSDGGKTIYRYANHDNGHGDIGPNVLVNGTLAAKYYAQPNSRNFQRGKLLSQSSFDSSGAIVSKDTMTYINDDSVSNNLIGVRAYSLKTKDVKMMSFSTSTMIRFGQAYIWVPNASPYVYYKHFYPTIKKTSTYYKSSDSLQTISSYTYDTTNNKIRLDSLKNLSDGSVKITTNNYPRDYVIGNSFYTGMINQNVIDPIIKQTVTNQSGKVLQVVKDSLVKNTFNSKDYYWLYEKDLYQVTTDITKMNILKYDSVANPIKAVGADGVPMTYIWDYGAMHPTAIVKNANDTAVVAYTSFEAEGLGGWIRNAGGTLLDNTSTTGQKVLSGGVYKTVPTGDYIVTLWAAANVSVNGQSGTPIRGNSRDGWWYYYEWKLTNVSSIQVWADAMDEVRLYPVGAQMTTYTYSPLCGITSSCSPSNIITYYNWDDPLGRLLNIKDMDGNIVKQFDYNYRQLVAPVSNTIQSRAFNKSCGTGYTPQYVNYVVPAGKYKSYVSVDDANAQALAEVQANGQHYADSVGVCYVTISSTNYAGVSGFTANYTVISNPSIVSHFSIPSTGGVIGSLPASLGPFSLTITKPGNSTIYTYGSGCGTTTMDGTSGSFSTVSVSPTTCNTISISIVH